MRSGGFRLIVHRGRRRFAFGSAKEPGKGVEFRQIDEQRQCETHFASDARGGAENVFEEIVEGDRTASDAARETERVAGGDQRQNKERRKQGDVQRQRVCETDDRTAPEKMAEHRERETVIEVRPFRKFAEQACEPQQRWTAWNSGFERAEESPEQRSTAGKQEDGDDRRSSRAGEHSGEIANTIVTQDRRDLKRTSQQSKQHEPDQPDDAVGEDAGGGR